MLRLLALVLLVLAVGCADTSFTPFRFIEKPRLVGALLSVQGDPARSTPGPGESVDVELLAVDPGPRLGRTWLLVACVPTGSASDIPSCASEPVIVGASFDVPGEGEPQPNPTATIAVPDEATLGEADTMVLLGAVCHGGELSSDLLLGNFMLGRGTLPPACADETLQGTIVASRVPVEREPRDRNFNPGVASVMLDGTPWDDVAAPEAPRTGCAGTGIRELVIGSLAPTLQVTATEGSLEPYQRWDGRRYVDDVEDLVARWFSTEGDLDQSYDTVLVDKPVAEIPWELPVPSAVPVEGLLVRFYGQLTDERGGASAYERAICVVRGP